MTQNDQSRMSSTETAEVQTYTQDQVDEMIAAAQRGNPAPAYEEGPHLQDAEIRAAKRQQMRDAGVSDDDENLTDDMLDILAEAD